MRAEAPVAGAREMGETAGALAPEPAVTSALFPFLVAALAPASAQEACPSGWAADALGLSWAWARTDQRGIDAPRVAVLEGGFRADHVDLAGRIDRGFDYALGVEAVTVPTRVEPDRGTWMAALVVGADDGVVAGTGVAPEGRVVLAQVGEATGALSLSALAAAMDHLAGGDAGAVGVAVTAAATGSSSRTLGEAVGALEAADVVLVVAAGDCDGCADPDLDGSPQYPAAYQGPHLLKVAAGAAGGGLTADARFGLRSVDLAAPGEDLCAAGVLSPTAAVTRSSAAGAAALTAGGAALVRAVYPELSAAETVALLKASAAPDPALEGQVATGGALDLDRVFQAAVPLVGPPVSAPEVLEIPISNLGPDGVATLRIGHHDELAISAVLEPDGWTVSPIEVGDPVPDGRGQPMAAPQPGSLVTGPLAEGAVLTVRLAVVGTAPGEGTVRGGAESPGAAWMPAPVQGNTVDADDAPAWTVSLDPAPADTGPAQVDGSIAPPEGCTCSAGAAPLRGGLAVGLLGLVALVRRRAG